MNTVRIYLQQSGTLYPGVNISQYLPAVEGDNLPRGKVPPTSSLVCSPSARPPPPSSGFSYLIPMYIVFSCGRRGQFSLGQSPPPPPQNLFDTHICFHFYVMIYDKTEWEEPGYLKFLKTLQEDTGNNFSSLWIQSIYAWVYGQKPQGKVSPSPASTLTHKSMVACTVMCRQDGRGRFLVLLDDLSKCRTNSQRKSQLS